MCVCVHKILQSIDWQESP
uniref:Uncharacterized protein n=1 Tax=Anopheles arabiensis TaxID=7173 RepID=A0A182IHH6_ANOAR